MPGAIDLTGQTFGRLTAKFRLPENDKHGQARWHCECVCGETTAVITSNLRSNLTRSCGCLKHDGGSFKHGLSNLAEYAIWATIKARCYSETSAGWVDYGARGIGMSDEWKESFPAFYRDMGPRPSKEHSVERENNEQGYCKENCRWATKLEQANNRRNSRLYELDGKTKTVSEWCREFGLKYTNVYMRLRRGMSFEDAIAETVLE